MKDNNYVVYTSQVMIIIGWVTASDIHVSTRRWWSAMPGYLALHRHGPTSENSGNS